ncbi:MAG: hypothetical protein ACYC7A_03350 [Thermoanaerobaculia bacterium]
MLLGSVLILASFPVASNPNAAARQAVAAAALAVLLPVLVTGDTTVTSLIKWFGVYPHAYAAAATTVLLCFGLRTASSIGTLRPATAVALVTAGSVLGLADRREQLLFLVAFVAVPLLTHIPGFAKLRSPFLLVYGVIEPLLVVALLWAFVPSLRTATFHLTLMEFEFLTAVMPSGVMLMMGGAALLHRAAADAVTDTKAESNGD